MEVYKERTVLTYTDYMVATGETRGEIINTTSILLRASKFIDLRVNEDRTKYLTVARKIPNLDHKTIGYMWNSRCINDIVDVVDVLDVNKNSSDKKINERIARSKLNNVMKSVKLKLPSH